MSLKFYVICCVFISGCTFAVTVYLYLCLYTKVGNKLGLELVDDMLLQWCTGNHQLIGRWINQSHQCVFVDYELKIMDEYQA